eukprot:407992_1
MARPMSRLLYRTHHGKSMVCVVSCTHHFKRFSSTNMDISDADKLHNQDLITDFLKYAKERIIEPEQRELSFRPRYKRLTVDESNLSAEEIINSTDNYLTVNDFMLGKILPINMAQNGIDMLHDYMPYFGAIMVAPFLAKICFTIPVSLWAQWRQDKILPFIPTAMKDYRKAANKYKGDRDKFNILTDKIKAKYGFNPLYAQFRPLLTGIVQLPVHMTFYIAIRTMYASYPDWKYGGIYWFSNLSIGDPYWILPVGVGCCMGLSFWNSMRYQKNDSMMLGGGAIPPGMIKGAFGLMAVCMIPIAHFWSAGFNLYMSANILSYMMQLMLLQNNQFRALFGIKSTQIQMQYQKELRDINTNANTIMKKDVHEDVQYTQIQDKYQRKRIQTIKARGKDR